MIARQALALPQLLLRAAAELAAIVVAGKQEGVGDLAAEAARDVDEANQGMTAGRGTAIRSLWTGVPSASTTSALPSMTSRSARRTGTMVSGSNEALRAKQRMRYANPTGKLQQVTRLHARCCLKQAP